jgi:uncharacterized protein (TIGR00730 family)
MKSTDTALLEQCLQFLDTLGINDNRELAADMMQTVIKLAKDDPGRSEMKLMLRSFKELRYAFKVFKPYRGKRKISIFGSARTQPDHPNYKLAMKFAKIAADDGFMVITGAGGGIMEAGHEGAGQAASFGVAIRLPFEQKTNPVIEKDSKLIHFRYFFSRKLVFVKETHAIALFPGGFGTHDEGFEVLTLVQTGRCDPMPIVLIEEPGGTYWKAWDHFIRHELVSAGLVSPEDTALYHITHDAREAADHIVQFYRNYHSLRYSNDKLILRMKHCPTDTELHRIRKDFADIVTEGTIECTTAEACGDDAMGPEMARLIFTFDRRSLARLRMLIDQLNKLPSLPPVKAPESAEIGSKESVRGVAEIAEEEAITLAGPGVKPSSRPVK